MKRPFSNKWLLIAIVLLISSCEKNSSNSYKDLLGTWTSTDLVDTVKITTEHDFYKTVGIPLDHFKYSLFGDSITIQYSGTLKILVQPTNHYYSLEGNNLTIDLRNCYGFRDQVITFLRK